MTKRLIMNLPSITTIAILIWAANLLIYPALSVILTPVVVLMLVLSFGVIAYTDWFQ